jgi:hypothetical protein
MNASTENAQAAAAVTPNGLQAKNPRTSAELAKDMLVQWLLKVHQQCVGSSLNCCSGN